MATHNTAYVMDTLSAEQLAGGLGKKLVDATPSEKEPAENIRYNNFYHTNTTGVKFKLGYKGKRGIVSPSMTISHPNQKGIIEKLDADPSKIDSFLQNVVVGTYNPGKGDALGSHFINFCALSVSGNVHQYGYARFEEADEDHAEIIKACAEVYVDSDEGRAAANLVATEILRNCKITYTSAVAVVHEYNF